MQSRTVILVLVLFALIVVGMIAYTVLMKQEQREQTPNEVVLQHVSWTRCA